MTTFQAIIEAVRPVAAPAVPAAERPEMPEAVDT